MNKEEHEYLENSFRKIMEDICMVTSLGRILENIYVTGNCIRAADIEYLIRAQNFHMDITRGKCHDLELYIMHQELG